MSNFNDKALKSVADAAAKIMGEALVGNQHKIDANKNGKVDAHDFKLLRAKKSVKEDAEQIDEISTKTLAAAAHAASDPDADYAYGMKKSMKHDPQKYADHAKKTKDAKSAAAVQGAADAKGHFPRPGHSFGGYDKLKSRENRSTNPSMVTKAGKLSKTSVKGLKSSLKEEEYLEEGGMPSSVIKHKQSLATKTPEQLHANFKEVAGRMGKSVEHVARSLAWSHGYGKGAGQGSSHYYDKVKHLEPKSESVEQIDEYNSKGGVYKHKGSYGYQGKGAEHGVSDHEKDTDMDDLDYQKKSKKLGARQNMGKRGQSDGTKKKKTNESFTAMLEMYNEHGLKYLAELGRVEEDVLIDETPGQDIQVINADIQNGYAEMTVEEVDNATFTKEMKDQEAKMNGKKKGGDVAKPSVQAVKQEEVEQIDELSKGTLGRYIKKAHFAGGMADFRHGMKHDKRGDSKEKTALAKTSHKREKGINKAVDRLTKEEVEQMDEISSDLANKWLSSPKGGNKYKNKADNPNGVGSTYPNEKTFWKHRKSERRAISRAAELPHHKKPSYYKEEEQIDEISKETAGKYLTAPQGKGANKYKTGEGTSKYPDVETMGKHATNVHRALSRSGSSSLYKKPGYYTKKD